MTKSKKENNINTNNINSSSNIVIIVHVCINVGILKAIY